jgi:hypothetical protein
MRLEDDSLQKESWITPYTKKIVYSQESKSLSIVAVAASTWLLGMFLKSEY